MTKQNILITICGRAGSQGFKNKNLKTFLGHPLVYYTLSAAELFIKQSGEITDIDICLNTDSEDLHNIVNDKYPSVNYIKREESLGGNTVPKPAVWKNSLDLMENKYKKKYDCLIDLDITSPLRQINDIHNAYILKTERPDADLVESMCHSRRNPYFNMMKEDGLELKSLSAIALAFMGDDLPKSKRQRKELIEDLEHIIEELKSEK